MKKKVLVVDDQRSILEVIELILAEEGYEVKTLAEGTEAIPLVKKWKPDLVMLDLWMPGIRGEDIAKMIRNDSQISHTPIIILSALNQTKDISQSCGANDFIFKPFEMDDLINMVRKYTS